MTWRRWFSWGGAAVVLTGLAIWGLTTRARRAEIADSPGVSDVPFSDTPYFSARGAASQVGSEKCAACHDAEHQSYLETAHSRALSEVFPENEPEDVEFQHKASGRRYRVYRDGHSLHHAEWLGDDDELKNDYTVRYLIGSGRHTRSYLVEADGFLVESPLTWYASRKAWGMSPGYDRPDHQGFERAADEGCLFCHAGRVEAVEGSLHRLKIHEQAIGCESCHGPGSLHVAHHKDNAGATGERDNTIVHPGRLSRALQESICAHCHLRGEATVAVRGRKPTEFRPGLPLSDFQVHYRFDATDSEMKVVGHVEQMRASRCWQKAEGFTCITCHDPHSPVSETEKLAFYRDKCLSCHAGNSCRLPESDRLRQNSDDSCAACHMPQVSTDIPHIAFTHHRVGIHRAKNEPSSRGQAIATLTPLDDISRFPQAERDRCLGLAYVELSNKANNERAARIYRDRGRELLEQAMVAGVRDAEMEATLAQLAWENDDPAAIGLAQAALNRPVISPRSRVIALFAVGETQFRAGQAGAAAEAIGQLVEMRRHSEDWLMLALCRSRLGETGPAVKAIEKAIAIHPFRPELHEAAAEIYGRAGDEENVRRQLRQAERIRSSVRQ